jgi:hypothetical protein
MKDLLIINAVTIICTLVSGILAIFNKPGWGWFLIVAVCLYMYPTKLKE